MVSMKKSQLRVCKQDRLIEEFVSGSTARTATHFYHRLREIIVLKIEQVKTCVIASFIQIAADFTAVQY